MPKRKDIKSIMIIGSGPIVIGQACEFDYSGTQACKALKEEGYRVILVNSNPATIMTDPQTADACYVEPLTWQVCSKIIKKEKPDALLPTLGGQTGLNVAIDLVQNGVLKEYKVQLLGASLEAIQKAESRDLFKNAMKKIGLKTPKSFIAYNWEDCLKAKESLGIPVIIRPAFTMGGVGGGLAFDDDEFEKMCKSGLQHSPVNEILIETSILGWKEYEMEVMRDSKDNAVIVCAIENLDALGVHTGDSITVAPAQTLTDKEYQKLRNASIAVLREIGVETGGANVQFALNPQNGELVVIEMNPRVSRSSALASKATGFPIAKIAAKLAVGYTLDEINNDITQKTPACFEPSIDYVVTKVPRFTFEKFPQTKPHLGSQMKSIGEAMAIGRTFKESLQKALRSLEMNFHGLDNTSICDDNQLAEFLNYKKPFPNRIFAVKRALQLGWSIQKVFDHSKIDYWFLNHILELVEFETQFSTDLKSVTPSTFKQAKAHGFSDYQIACLTNCTEQEVTQQRYQQNILPVFKTVDTCAGEFEAFTPYHYSTYENQNELKPSQNKKVIIIGSGPNRIGQGIEFDYSCCHAAYTLKEEGLESIMVNSNPETVSTDYDTSDKLYFEPLRFEELMNIIHYEKPNGVIVQFGGQTSLKLANQLEQAGVKILGTSPHSINLAEDRKLFSKLAQEIGLLQPSHGLAVNEQEALTEANRVGYPILVRPSFVLGGRAMMIIHHAEDLKKYIEEAVQVSNDRPVLIDSFLEGAIEIDVDAISDGHQVVVAGIMEHIERAGVHSGDSASVLPPHNISQTVIEKIEYYTTQLAKKLQVVGLINIQYAIKNSDIYIIEANPRASRTIPYVSKAIGVPLAKLATQIMLGKTLSEIGYTQKIIPPYYSVKESVFPFIKFKGVDTLLSPEMKSTGEVMGIDIDWKMAFAKSQIAANNQIKIEGKVFLSVGDADKNSLVPLAKKLTGMNLELLATVGTAKKLKENGIKCITVNKVYEGQPHVIDRIENDSIALLINSPVDNMGDIDGAEIRTEAMQKQIPYTTTIEAASAFIEGMEAMAKKSIEVKSLQEYHQF